jgi:hypothetical protein
MVRARQLHFLGEVHGQGQARALLRQVGDTALDVRGIPRGLIMLCPDGCGEVLTLNLDPRSGKAWRLYRYREKVTLYPSVWRDDGCGAHFIVWRDTVLWCDWADTAKWEDRPLVEAVRGELARNPRQFQHYDAIALRLSAVPWEVSWACDQLVREGTAEKRKLVEYRIRQTDPGTQTGRGST